MSVILLSVSFPYLGGVITFQVGRVTKLEGYNNIWRVRGRFDRGGGGWEGGKEFRIVGRSRRIFHQLETA